MGAALCRPVLEPVHGDQAARQLKPWARIIAKLRSAKSTSTSKPVCMPSIARLKGPRSLGKSESGA